VDIEAVIEALGSRFDADEAEVVKRVLAEYSGNIPETQLIEEAALTLAIFRRSRR